MKVYRYLSEDELRAILSGNTQNIGSYYNNKDFKEVNTHKYKDGVRYLHFFKDTRFIHQISYLHQNDKRKYFICQFDIPLKYLIFNIGIGRYETRGYENYCQSVIEFKMDAKNFNPKWLVTYKLDRTKDMWQKLKD